MARHLRENFWEVKRNMLDMLKLSRVEFAKYNPMRHETQSNLQVSGEALFSTYERYIEMKMENQYRNIPEIWEAIYNGVKIKKLSEDDKNLYGRMLSLHDFFYHGENSMHFNEAKQMFNDVIEKIEGRVKRI